MTAAAYQNVRCPTCNRWLCAVEGGISPQRRVRVNCTNCKREYVLPFPPADDTAPPHPPHWRKISS